MYYVEVEDSGYGIAKKFSSGAVVSSSSCREMARARPGASSENERKLI